MRIALIQCPSWSTVTPPYNLALLSACLKKEGHEIFCFDLNMAMYKYVLDKEGENAWGTKGESNAWLEESYVRSFIKQYDAYIDYLVDQILETGSRFIGFSIQDTSRHFAQEIINRIKRKDANRKIILGGYPFFGNSERLTFFNNNVDAICLKEGEFPLVNLIKIFERDGGLDYCPGFICKNRNGDIIDGGELPLIDNLDMLPFADFSGFQLNDYKKMVLPISTSRGCVFHCAFCAETACWEKYRHRSAGNIFNEMLFQLEKFPDTKGFFFNDSLIDGDFKMLDELCALIIKSGKKISWGGQGSIRKEMTPQFLKKLKKAGFCHVSYGLESGNPKILRLMRKGFDLKTAEEVIRNTYRLGIYTTVNIVVGFPGETEEDVLITADFLKRNIIKFVNDIYFHSLVISPQTILYNNKESFGIKLPDTNWVNFWFTQDGSNNYEIRLKRIKLLKQMLKDKYTSNITEFNYYCMLGDEYRVKNDYENALKFYLKAKAEIKDNNDISLIEGRIQMLEKNNGKNQQN